MPYRKRAAKGGTTKPASEKPWAEARARMGIDSMAEELAPLEPIDPGFMEAAGRSLLGIDSEAPWGDWEAEMPSVLGQPPEPEVRPVRRRRRSR